jgi:hypothetical protein
MKVGRNEPCPCGSGKKFKHCCALKKDQRSRMQDSLFKGVFLLFGPLAVVLIGVIAYSALRGPSTTDEGLERVWSSEHGHWHVILPDGTETEVRPGMVWDPDHGHFHRVGGVTEGARKHVTADLDQRLDDVEADIEP